MLHWAHHHFRDWPSAALSIALALTAIALLLVALLPRHSVFKSLVLAWVWFP